MAPDHQRRHLMRHTPLVRPYLGASFCAEGAAGISGSAPAVRLSRKLDGSALFLAPLLTEAQDRRCVSDRRPSLHPDPKTRAEGLKRPDARAAALEHILAAIWGVTLTGRYAEWPCSAGDGRRSTHSAAWPSS